MKEMFSWIQISLTDINADLIIHSCKTTFQNYQWKERKFWFHNVSQRWNEENETKFKFTSLWKLLGQKCEQTQQNVANLDSLLFWINCKIWGYSICFSLKPAASNMLGCWYFAIQKCSGRSNWAVTYFCHSW
jgi:hypothetical protein